MRLNRPIISKSLTNATSTTAKKTVKATVKTTVKATGHSAQSLETWHKRLGYLNYADVR